MLRVSNSTEEASASTRSNFKLSAFVNVSGPLAAHSDDFLLLVPHLSGQGTLRERRSEVFSGGP